MKHWFLLENERALEFALLQTGKQSAIASCELPVCSKYCMNIQSLSCWTSTDVSDRQLRISYRAVSY